MTKKEKIIEEDVEYLEQEFPKGKTKYRGQAMVLLSLARRYGELKALQSRDEEEIEFLKNLKERCEFIFNHEDFGTQFMELKERIETELKQKLKENKND